MSPTEMYEYILKELHHSYSNGAFYQDYFSKIYFEI